MAETNIVAGLFGMNPQMYERQQYQQDLQQGYDLARLDPGAAARAQLPAGIGQIGRGFAGAMGIEDPQLKMISQTNQLMQGLDLRDPQSLQNAAQQASQMGNIPLAMKLIELSDNAQIRSQQEQVRLQQAQAQRQTSLAQLIAQRAYDPGTQERAQMLDVQERQQMADQGTPMPENIAATAPSYDIRRVAPQLQALGAPGLAQLTAGLTAAKAMRPETVSIKEGETLYTVPTEEGQGYKPIAFGGEKPRPFTGDLANAANILYRTDDPAKIFAKFGQAGLDAVEQRAFKIAEGKRPVTNITAPVTIQMQKGFGEDLTETLTANLRAGRVAGSTLGTVQSMKTLIDEGTRTGFGQETMLQLGRAGQAFDPNFKVAGIAGAEAFQAFSNSVILPEIKKLGTNPTDTDLKFSVQAAPSLSKSPQGNLILLDTLELKLKREQDLAKFSNQWLAQNANTVKANPIIAQTLFNDAFNNYVETSPLYKPQAEMLRQRVNQLQTTGAGRTPTPARNTLQRGNFINP
jgi:hypothetical protein